MKDYILNKCWYITSYIKLVGNRFNYVFLGKKMNDFIKIKVSHAVNSEKVYNKSQILQVWNVASKAKVILKNKGVFEEIMTVHDYTNFITILGTDIPD